VWDLPIVFVCENNLYMEYTPIDLVTPVKHPAADRASAYGLEPILVDGNDADDVYDTARRVIARVRNGGGPALVEAVTYRHGGHSRADPGKYRPAEEVAAWMDRDPIPMYHQRLLRLGVPEGDLTRIEQEVAQRVDEATEFAKSGERPSPDVMMTDMWSDGGSEWRN
jgi:pyruvate dehydrogenase E1 component alpha subunit